MRLFRRRSLRMRTAAQKRCPASFERRMLAAFAEHPATIAIPFAGSLMADHAIARRTSPCACPTASSSAPTRMAACERKHNDGLLCGEQERIAHIGQMFTAPGSFERKVECTVEEISAPEIPLSCSAQLARPASGGERHGICLPGDLETQIEAFVADYNRLRYHERIANLTPADVYFGRGQTILIERERIKRQTIANRRLLHRRQVA
jgi:hypothetical protein